MDFDLEKRLNRQKRRLKDRVDSSRARPTSLGVNFALITLDSCRYDAFCSAEAPLLKSYGPWVPGYSPASYTYAAHHSFFAGLFPNAILPIPYYNRYIRQLVGLIGVGEKPGNRSTFCTVASSVNMVDGFRRGGFQTVGTGAMNWFKQDSLTGSFDEFELLKDADSQIDYALAKVDVGRPFFLFLNFGETHDPFEYAGKERPCPIRVQARGMVWPPKEEGPVGKDNEAFWHQVEAVSFLDGRLKRLFTHLPGNTIAIVCGDHGECFGEDGFWGHGVNHPKVYEVPLGIFRLDRRPIEPDVRVTATPTGDG